MEDIASSENTLGTEKERAPADTDLDKRISLLKRDFKHNVGRELRRREGFQSPYRRKKRVNPIPFLPQDTVAYSLLRRARLAQDVEVIIRGAENLPTDNSVSGSVGIIRILGIEEESYLMGLDRRKQRYDDSGAIILPLRWNFPGGRREEREHPVANLLRELREETGLYMKSFKFTFIDAVPLVYAPDLRQAIFFTSIPERVVEQRKPGKEQLRLEIFTRRQIEFMATQDLEAVDMQDLEKFLELGVLLDNHANYFAAFKKWELAEKMKNWS